MLLCIQGLQGYYTLSRNFLFFYLCHFIYKSLARFGYYVLSVSLCGLMFCVDKSSAQSLPSPLPIIAITQIVAHSSLDKVRQGAIDELAAQGFKDGKTIQIVYKNSQGTMALATQIAQQFVSQKPAAILAIATPSAQAVVNAAKATAIPVVFATITDPIQAKLVTNLQHPGGMVTGTRNVSPIEQQLDLIQQILPHVKTLGIVLNFGEQNSVDLLQSVRKVAQQKGIAIKTAPAPTSADVSTATASIANRVDALFLLQDNTVAAALPVLLKMTQNQQIPVFSSYADAVKDGALAGVSFDEYMIGRQSGAMLAKILRGKKPGELPVEDPKQITFAINLITAKQLHINIAPRLLLKSQFIYPLQGGR